MILGGLVASGALWGAVAFLAPDEGDVEILMTLSLFAAGMTAGAAAALNAPPFAFACFALPLLVMLSAKFALLSTHPSLPLAAAAAAFTVVMYGIAVSGRREVTRALRLWLANRRLRIDLQRSRANELAALGRASASNRARREAEEAAAAKSRFLATVSHELRTPLNAVIGFSDMIADEFYGPIGNVKYNEYAQEIRGSGLRLLRLIDDMLDVSVATNRIEPALHFEAVSVETLCQSVAREFALAGHDRLQRIRIQVTPPGLTVRADQRLLRRIVQNLVENAIKFSPPDSEISLVGGVDEKGHARLRVRDHGIGIPTEKLEAVTEPFTQLDDTDSRIRTGAGLGLTIVKRYVDLHGGALRLDSPNGAGLLVEITLPPSEQAASGQQDDGNA